MTAADPLELEAHCLDETPQVVERDVLDRALKELSKQLLRIHGTTLERDADMLRRTVLGSTGRGCSDFRYRRPTVRRTRRRQGLSVSTLTGSGGSTTHLGTDQP